MPYIIGAAAALIFIVCLAAAFYLGYRLGRKRRKSGQAKTTQQDAAAALREKQLLQELELISSYNLGKALERKQA